MVVRAAYQYYKYQNSANTTISRQGKKGSKDVKKKPGKVQVAAYESPLQPSPAGFESLVFLIDEYFEGLPFDLLHGLQSIPAISYDSSIFYLSRKMQSINFKPQANNSNGFGGDKGKYIAYQFKQPSLGFRQIYTQLKSQIPNIKFQGVSSNDRIPSIGDYKKYLNDNGYIQIYGSLDMLNYMKLPILVQSCGIAKSKLMIIMDHINYQKSLINKYQALDSNSQSTSIDEQQKIWKIISNLLDLTLIKNLWCLSKEQNKLGICNFYKNLGLGYYVGACFRCNKNQEKGGNSNFKMLRKGMNRIYGCPVLRI